MRNHLPKSVSQSTILLVLLLWAGFWFHTTPTKTILIILKTRFCFWISDFLSRLIFSGSHFLFSTHSAFTMQRLSVLNSSQFSSVQFWCDEPKCDYTILQYTHTLLFSTIALKHLTQMRLLIAQTQMYQKSFSIEFRLMRRFVNVFRQFIHLDIIVLCLMSESFTWLKRNFCSYFGPVCVSIRNFCVDKNRTLIRRSYRICVTQLNLSPSTISLFVYTDTVYRLYAPHIKSGFWRFLLTMASFAAFFMSTD